MLTLTSLCMFIKKKIIIIIPYLLHWTGTEMSQNTAFSLSTSAKTIESESLHNAVLNKFVMEQCAFTNECAMKIWRRFVLTVANQQYIYIHRYRPIADETSPAGQSLFQHNQRKHPCTRSNYFLRSLFNTLYISRYTKYNNSPNSCTAF